MPYKPRYVRRLSKRNKRNLLVTLILVGFVLYATFRWIFPNFVGVLASVTSFLKPQTKIVNISENTQLAPPVLNIPFEATNTSQINIEGYATPNSKVKLFLDDVEVDTEDVNSEGKFLFEDVSLSLGINNIYGKSVDDKGKESLSSKTLIVLYDDENPKLEITSPQDGAQISGERKVHFEGLTEPDAKVYINESQIIVDNNGNFKIDLSLNDGENRFIIKAKDLALNETQIERVVNFTP